MKNKVVTWLDKLLSFGETHPKRLVFYLVLLGGTIQFLIQSTYWIGKWKGIVTDFSAGEVLGFWGSFLAFIGTFVLGAIALWQNKKVSDINERLLEIEEAKYCPMFDLLELNINYFENEYKPYINSNYLIYSLDERDCEIQPDNKIRNDHTELTIVLDCENTSETRIITSKLTGIFVYASMPDGDELTFETNNISYCGKEKFDPKEKKPLIISGIDNFFQGSDQDHYPNIQVTLFFNLTNAIGDIYHTKMSFFISTNDFQSKVIFPQVYAKNYEKPKKYI